MRTALVALLLMLSACSGPRSPEDTLFSFFESLKAGKGDQAVSHLHPEAVEALATGMNLETLRRNPRDASSHLASFGIGVAPEEMDTLTPKTLVNRLAASPLLTALIREATLHIEGVSVEESRAGVQVTLTLPTGTLRGNVDLLREHRRWRIVGGELSLAE